MLESNDPDAIPTLDEESLDMKERELLEHWANNSPLEEDERSWQKVDC